MTTATAKSDASEAPATAAGGTSADRHDATSDLAQPSSLAADLLHHLPAQMLLLGQDLRIRWANDAFGNLCKVPAAQLTGRQAADFLTDLPAHSALFERLFSGEVSTLPLSMQLRVDGETCDLRVRARLLDRNNESKVLCLLITEVHQGRSPAQTALSNTVEVMRQVLTALPNLVMVLDDQLRVLHANRGMRGHTVAQLEGMHVSNFLPDHLEATALAAMRRALASGEVDGYMGEVEDSAGRTRHFDVRVSAIRCGEQIAGLTLNAGETTERVLAERAIATQARMIESMLEGVAVIDENGLIEISNPAFDAMFGYARGELLKRDMAALGDWPFESRGRWYSLNSDSAAVEFDGRRRNGERFFAAGVLSVFEIAGRHHSLLVLQDVSERRQLERGILEAVNREQYRIGNDLHDGLGQELTGIALMLRGLAGRLTGEYPPLLPEIESITRLVSNAIESTRALARGLSPVNLERGGLQDALESLAMNASELYGVPTVFTHRLSANRPLNPELANHLYRIAQEAVRNAVRHGQARSIRLHLNMLRAKVRLAITDDGIGMSTDAMDAAGMGLKIMCYRARMLGGDVSFEPVQPRGTRVVCECPLEPNGAIHVRRLSKSRERS